MRIYYFSGTGNSFFVAKELHTHFAGSSMESIMNFRQKEIVKAGEDEIVIVCPIHHYGIPIVAEEFINKIETERSTPLSIICTAEFPNGIAMGQVNKLCKKKDLNLQRSFYLKMPTNYVIGSKMLSQQDIEKTYTQAAVKIGKILNLIESRKRYVEGDSTIYRIITSAKTRYDEYRKRYGVYDADFFITDKCKRCGKCEINCPSKNISMDGEPQWKGECLACLRCINICPTQAIEFGEKSLGKDRYFNQEIGLEEYL